MPHPGRSIMRLRTERICVSLAQHHAEFVNWGFYEPVPWRNYLHTHSFYEVCYAYSGRGIFRVGEQTHEVGADTLFLARPGDVHEIISSDDDPLGIYFWAYTLLREPRPAEGRHQTSAAEEDTNRLLEAFAVADGPRVRHRPGPFTQLLELLTHEAAAPGPAHGNAVGAMTTGLVLETARALRDESDPLTAVSTHGHAETSAARVMICYLHDNYDRRVTVEDVAAQVHLSERHAARLFRESTGLSVHAYLTRLRLEVAAGRLLEHGSSIKEVARSCGYTDVRHFTTAFRRRWGSPPATFRARDGTTHL